MTDDQKGFSLTGFSVSTPIPMEGDAYAIKLRPESFKNVNSKGSQVVAAQPTVTAPVVETPVNAAVSTNTEKPYSFIDAPSQATLEGNRPIKLKSTVLSIVRSKWQPVVASPASEPMEEVIGDVAADTSSVPTLDQNVSQPVSEELVASEPSEEVVGDSSETLADDQENVIIPTSEEMKRLQAQAETFSSVINAKKETISIHQNKIAETQEQINQATLENNAIVSSIPELQGAIKKATLAMRGTLEVLAHVSQDVDRRERESAQELDRISDIHSQISEELAENTRKRDNLDVTLRELEEANAAMQGYVTNATQGLDDGTYGMSTDVASEGYGKSMAA